MERWSDEWILENRKIIGVVCSVVFWLMVWATGVLPWRQLPPGTGCTLALIFLGLHVALPVLALKIYPKAFLVSVGVVGFILVGADVFNFYF